MKKIFALFLMLVMAVTVLTVTTFAVVDTSDNYYVLGVADLRSNHEEAYVNVSELESDGKSYLRIKPDTTSSNSKPSDAYVSFNIFGSYSQPSFNVNDFPYVGVSYKTNIYMNPAELHINAGMMKKNGYQYLRCYGLKATPKTDGSRAVAIYDVRNFTGAAETGNTGLKYTGIDPSKGIKFIRIPPWAKYQETALSNYSDYYFDIEYIGFFKTKEDAVYYFDNSQYTVTYHDKDGKVYGTPYQVYPGEEHITIDGSEEDKLNVDGLRFDGWVTSSGTAVPQSFTVDTNYELYPTYSRDLNYYVYPASGLETKEYLMTSQDELILEDGLSWSRFYVSKNGTSAKNYIEFYLDEYFPVKKIFNDEDELVRKGFNFVAVKYKTNIQDLGYFATSASLKSGGTYYRFFGKGPENVSGKADDNVTEGLLIEDLSKIRGGEGGASGKTFSDVDDDSDIAFIRLSPWGSEDIDITTKDYIDIAYIGFFQTAAEAEAFFNNEGSGKAEHEPFMEFEAIPNTDVTTSPKFQFRPDDMLTRGEAANIIARIIADTNKIAYVYKSGYTNFDENNDCYSNVAYLEKLGYLTANGDPFNPDNSITVDDLVELINKAADGYPNVLSNVDASDISDDSGSTPRFITRAQAAKLFCDLLGRSPTAQGLSYSVAPGPFDVKVTHPLYAYILEACYDHNYLSNSDNTEIWTNINDNSFYMKKVDGDIINGLNSELQLRIKNILDIDSSEYTGTVFYVSNNGSDSNDGLEPKKAIQTIDKILELQRDNIIKYGDVVLFERGGTWRPSVEKNTDEVVTKQNKLVAKEGVTYSSYGVGPKPIILGSIDGNTEDDDWTLVDKDVYPNLYVFNTQLDDGVDVGNIVFNGGTFTWEGNELEYTYGTAYGVRLIQACTDKSELIYADNAVQIGHNEVGENFIVSNGIKQWIFNTKNYPFYGSNYDKISPDIDIKTVQGQICDIAKIENSDLWYYHDKIGKQLYLISKEGDPDERFTAGIELCTRGNAITAKSNVTIDNLCIKFTGSHGISSSSCENLTVKNCEIGWIGGSIANPELQGNTVRFGNGVQVYGNADGFYVEDCYIYQCFDCGVTVQYSTTNLTWGTPVIEKDVRFSRNALLNAALEVWLTTKEENFGRKYAVLQDCTMEDNLVAFNGYGFQGYTHYKHDYCGFYGAGDTYADYIKCSIKDNKFWNLRINLLKATPTSVNNGDGFLWENNTIIQQYDNKLGLLGQNTKEASGGLTEYTYNNSTIKKLLSDGAFGHNEFLYTLAEGAQDPAENQSGIDNGIVRGDSDGNGEQEIEDLFLFTRYMAKWSGSAEDMHGANSDLNGDKKLTGIDLVILARRLANWEGYND